MKALLAGYGEIGKAVYANLKDFHAVTLHDPAQGIIALPADYDVLLVAFPCSYAEEFAAQVGLLKELAHTEHVIVFSTVPIGTCAKLGATHCPIEGRHPDLAQSVSITARWVGGHDEVCLRFLTEADFDIEAVVEPHVTEFLKLRSTTLYGVNIEFARYSKSVCDVLGIDFEYVKRWDSWVNELYADLGMPQFTRYILDPPEGQKGGHCVTPNARLLMKQYPHLLVGIVANDG